MYNRKTFLTILLVLLFFIVAGGVYAAYWRLPPLPDPPDYGNLLINRTSEKNGELPVTFSHWSHRIRYTCRVCHFELSFEMKVNTTEITEDANRRGEYCGACHNGKIAFDHSNKNCRKCHNGDIHSGNEKFEDLKELPCTPFGNKIDWVTAAKEGLINPKQSIREIYRPLPYNKLLRLEAEWTMVPDAFFPHEAHNRWLDCSNCHPDIFNIKKKTTKHFSMKYILEGKFCGACHMNVAFPIDDCKRCHPQMKV
jgi:c(7)-type cytochrome triheme protein